MTESNEKPRTNFAGVYFDRDSVIRLARLANIFAWASLIYYVVQVLVALTIFILQFVRGFISLPGYTVAASRPLRRRLRCRPR